ncbi:MAG: LLM class flavin-dependent oxidoreductase [Actinobacteria bacterium]|nr:LLM class flavin-dependent oxidoreductase [Actinomycetota bacterium]
MTAALGLTLPTFVDDPEVLVDVARAADATAIDGVFTFDHLYRIGSHGHDPALALEPVLGALAVETQRVAFGPLVARATLRRPPSLRAALDTVHRIAPGRLIAGVGAGDRLSDPENEMFGLPTGRVSVRLSALGATVGLLRGRGYPVWVGGRSSRILGTAAALADGWNGWNLSPGAFRLEVDRLTEAVHAAQRREGAVVATWGGLVELRPSKWDEARERPDVLAGPWERMAETLRHLVDGGARWLILAPIASSDPENAEVVMRELAPLLS